MSGVDAGHWVSSPSGGSVVPGPWVWLAGIGGPGELGRGWWPVPPVLITLSPRQMRERLHLLHFPTLSMSLSQLAFQGVGAAGKPYWGGPLCEPGLKAAVSHTGPPISTSSGGVLGDLPEDREGIRGGPSLHPSPRRSTGGQAGVPTHCPQPPAHRRRAVGTGALAPGKLHTEPQAPLALPQPLSPPQDPGDQGYSAGHCSGGNPDPGQSGQHSGLEGSAPRALVGHCPSTALRPHHHPSGALSSEELSLDPWVAGRGLAQNRRAGQPLPLATPGGRSLMAPLGSIPGLPCTEARGHWNSWLVWHILHCHALATP